MAIQRAEAQTPTPTKLAAAHTAAHEFRHQLQEGQELTIKTRCFAAIFRALSFAEKLDRERVLDW
jgi:hypothetical protein